MLKMEVSITIISQYTPHSISLIITNDGEMTLQFAHYDNSAMKKLNERRRIS